MAGVAQEIVRDPEIGCHDPHVGIVIELRDWSGEAVRGMGDPSGGTFDAAGDLDRVLSVADTSFALLKYVDPYGSTVFNSLQIPDLQNDLERLAALDLAPTERRGLERLRVMADLCGSGSNLYLWFLGD